MKEHRAFRATFAVNGIGVHVYRVASPGWRAMWNSYPSKTIGAAFVTGSLCWSLVWRRP
jgi:hypothetical protein